MPKPNIETGFASVDNANIYYEIAGDGQPFVMIHAGVCDSRQWNNEFSHYAESFRVIRYDYRGYGKSEPVEGDFTNLKDLTTLLDHLHIDEPLIMMGCSMGGGLAMDFALANPNRVKALIMVDSGPSGLELDVPKLSKFDDAEKAYNEGNLDLLAEIETQIWFDGQGRTPEQVDQPMRKLAYEMNRHALELDAKHLGKRLPDAEVPAARRLDELKIPVLVIVGTHDTPYTLAAVDHMVAHIPNAQKAIIEDAAHMPNMDHPEEFKFIVDKFLSNI